LWTSSEHLKKAIMKALSQYRISIILLLSWTVSSSHARAALGSFEAGEGYHISLNGGVVSGQTLIDAGDFTLNGYLPTAEYFNVSLAALAPDYRYGPDVSRYNAGTYSGGLPLDIRDNTGLWTAIYGGRLTEDDFAGPWDGWGSDYAAATSVNAHSGLQSLALRAMDDRISYGYALDAQEISATASSFELSFWLDPSATDNSYGSNVFDLVLNDASGAAFMELGYSGSDFLQYRLHGQSFWNTTDLHFGNKGWSEISLLINTNSDSFSLSGQGFDDTQGTLQADRKLISDAAMGIHPSQLNSLTLNLQGGYLDASSTDSAHYFDDFSLMAVPEPGSALLLALSGLVFLRRRR